MSPVFTPGFTDTELELAVKASGVEKGMLPTLHASSGRTGGAAEAVGPNTAATDVAASRAATPAKQTVGRFIALSK
jgi:hypothetical protein